jgi:hypothetical protein
MRLWPWSSGAPVEAEHTELEERMSPDVQGEYSTYDFQSGHGQATAGQEGSRQAGDSGEGATPQQQS